MNIGILQMPLLLFLLFLSVNQVNGNENSTSLPLITPQPTLINITLDYQVPCPNNSLPTFGSPTPPHHLSTWFVHLDIENKDGSKHPCSGVLFSPSLILTSANCLGHDVKSYGWSVYAGLENHQFLENGTKGIVQEFLHHPLYRKFHFEPEDPSYDLAIVALFHPFKTKDGELATIGFPTLIDPAPFLGSTAVSPRKDMLFPLSRWNHCQVAGSGKIFDTKEKTCVSSKIRRYSSGIVLDADSCKAVRKLGENNEKYVEGTACFYNNTDLSCWANGGAGVTCVSSTDEIPVLVGIIRDHSSCCNGNNTPRPRNLVFMDIEKREWISKVANHHYQNGVLEGPPLPTAPKPRPREEWGKSDDDFWMHASEA